MPTPLPIRIDALVLVVAKITAWLKPRTLLFLHDLRITSAPSSMTLPRYLQTVGVPKNRPPLPTCTPAMRKRVTTNGWLTIRRRLRVNFHGASRADVKTSRSCTLVRPMNCCYSLQLLSNYAIGYLPNPLPVIESGELHRFPPDPLDDRSLLRNSP